MTQGKSSQRKKGWTPDTRPARARYWAQHSLVKNKVRNLMRQRRADGSPRFASKAEAIGWWVNRSGRKRWGKLTEWAAARRRATSS